MSVIGVDIGGTGVRAATVDAEGHIGPIVRRTLSDRSPEGVMAAIVAVLEPLAEGPVGVGVPGFVIEGEVMGSPNFPSWDRLPLAVQLSQRLGRRVAVENDANCAALGVWSRRGRSEDLVVLTLGTGVGGGIIAGGELLVGSRGCAAEVGHISVGGDRTCGCGGLGCLEGWVGTEGLRAEAARRGRELVDGASLIKAASAGEPWAEALLHEAGTALGCGVRTLLHLFDPDAVVLLGGMTAARNWLEPAMGPELGRAISVHRDHAAVVWGGRAEEYAIVGAAERVR